MSKLMIGKVVVITGGACGNGRSTAFAFAREGARVVIGDIDGTGAEKTVAMIRNRSGEASGVCVDVAKSADVQQMVTSAVDQYAGRGLCVQQWASSGRPPVSSKQARKIGNVPWRRT